MIRMPRAQEIYKHFKGNLYQIVSVAEHTETGEILVVYQAMYGDFKIYARPLEMFTGEVEHDKYPEVTQKYRFELQSAWSSQEEKVSMTKPCEAVPVAEVCIPVPEENACEPKEAELDPMLLEFLDADTYEQRLNILTGMHHKITNEMLTTMAIVCDIELEEGDVESRYNSLKNCLVTLDKYEISRA